MTLRACWREHGPTLRTRRCRHRKRRLAEIRFALTSATSRGYRWANGGRWVMTGSNGH